jgi:hypothetical protein
MAKAFGSAMHGTSKGKSELVDTPIPLKAPVYSLKADCDTSFLNNLFDPLGFSLHLRTLLRYERFSLPG